VDFEEQYMRLTHEPRNQNLKNLANIWKVTDEI
jgi:hypothetical protein